MSSPLCFIIEDNPDASRIFSKIIERKGFEFEQITDGRTALLRLTHSTPALVLLDMHLPFVTGVQIFELIRSQPHLDKTAVIVVSADHSMTRTIEDAVDFVMLKPVNVPQLSAIVDRITYQQAFLAH